MKNNWLRNILIGIIILLVVGGIIFFNIQFFKNFDKIYFNNMTEEPKKESNKTSEKNDKKTPENINSSKKDDKKNTLKDKEKTKIEKPNENPKTENPKENDQKEKKLKKIRCNSLTFNANETKETIEAYFENDVLTKIKISETVTLEYEYSNDLIDILNTNSKELNTVNGFEIKFEAPSSSQVKTIISVIYRKLDESKLKSLYKEDADDIIKLKDINSAKFEEEYKNHSYFCNIVES